MWFAGWWASRKRAEALRRLGGPDLDAERKKNAMNGEQKAVVMVVMTVATLLGWCAWNFAAYHTSAAEREASSRPTPEAILDWRRPVRALVRGGSV